MLVGATIDLLRMLSGLKLTEREIALLNAVILFHPGKIKCVDGDDLVVFCCCYVQGEGLVRCNCAAAPPPIMPFLYALVFLAITIITLVSWLLACLQIKINK